MYLFILETIGTQELILIGIVALIVFGPRKLPTMARKAGQMMRELRSVSSDFRATWEKEVNFEEDNSNKKLEKNEEPIPYLGEGETFGEEIKVDSTEHEENSILPEIKEVSKEDFEKLVADKKNGKPEPTEKITSEKSEWF